MPLSSQNAFVLSIHYYLPFVILAGRRESRRGVAAQMAAASPPFKDSG
ncbi:hypothetical protein [Candidatus Spongiihabitans sp.]